MKERLSRPSDVKPLISATEIAARVSEMAREISQDYRGKPLVAVVILRGAFIFASDLVRHLDADIDLNIEFIHASSYRDATVSSGRVELAGPDPTLDRKRHVLIVEDVLDSGLTVREVVRHLQLMSPPSIEIAALLSKERSVHRPTTARYVGFRIPDVFVVGYGLDLAQHYRHLPDISVLRSK
jgi:hypoxanthine phosphoribosyltransferase